MMTCKTCIITWLDAVMRFFATLLTFATLTAHAQTDAPAGVPEQVIVSLYANVSIPSSSFKAAIDNPNGGAGVGIGTQLLFNPKGKRGSSPFYPGIDFFYLTFGRDKQDGSTTVPPYKTTFNYYSIAPSVRFLLNQKTTGFTPFVDGQVGAKIFNTRTKIDKNAFDTILNDDQPEVINTTNDTGLGYGLGAGFFVRKARGENGVHLPSFTIRVQYLWGDDITYVKRGSVKIDNGYVSYDTATSDTNMFLIQLGIAIR